jgi:ubiquinone/menaquinone biosynthesis C-methylase UbiE
MAITRHLLHGNPHPGTPGRTIDQGHNYELFTAMMFGGRRNRVFTRLAALSGAKPGDSVLDVGCGTGYLTRKIAAVAAPGGTVTGVDPSGPAVEHARRLAREGNDDCEFETGFAEALDAADDSLDVVVSSLMIHHLPEELRHKAVEEMHRVLRPGGRLLVADFRPPSGRLGRRVVGSIVGPGMANLPIHLLEPLITATGFERTVVGDLHPWIRYVQAVKP